jgi:hypothetical protein
MSEIISSDDPVIESLAKVCLHVRTTVVSTWRSGHIIMRRRMCLDCKTRFRTEEKRRVAIKRASVFEEMVDGESSLCVRNPPGRFLPLSLAATLLETELRRREAA